MWIAYKKVAIIVEKNTTIYMKKSKDKVPTSNKKCNKNTNILLGTAKIIPVIQSRILSTSTKNYLHAHQFDSIFEIENCCTFPL